MGLRAVLFDLGDTLVDHGPMDPWDYLRAGAEEVCRRLRENKGSAPDVDAYERRLGRAIRLAYVWSRVRGREVDVYGVLERAHRRWSIDLSREEIRQIIGVFYRPLRERGVVQPTTPEVLTWLQGLGLVLGMVSNTIMPGELLDDHLAELGLLGFFPVRIYSSDVRYVKPDERIFRIALGMLGVTASETMFVGDAPGVDVRGANRLGMISVWRRSFLPADRRFPARHEIRELTELPEIVRSYLDE